MILLYHTCNITYMQDEIDKLLQMFGKHFKKLRIKKGSLNKFALNNTGLSTATISRIENGLSNFKFVTFMQLANALEMSPSELLENFNFIFSDYKH